MGRLEIAAAAQDPPDRIQAVLPPPHILVRRQACFGEDEFPARLENPGHFSKRPRYIGRVQSVNVTRTVSALRSGKGISSAPACRTRPVHRRRAPSRRPCPTIHWTVECPDVPYPRLVVEGEVQPRTEAHFQDAPKGERNHFRPLPHARLRAAGEVHDLRENEACVETHHADRWSSGYRKRTHRPTSSPLRRGRPGRRGRRFSRPAPRAGGSRPAGTRGRGRRRSPSPARAGDPGPVPAAANSRGVLHHEGEPDPTRSRMRRGSSGRRRRRAAGRGTSGSPP